MITVPACHTLWLPVSLRCSVHISSSAWRPSPLRRHLHAAWCPSSGPECMGRRSGEPHFPTTGTLVKHCLGRQRLFDCYINSFVLFTVFGVKCDWTTECVWICFPLVHLQENSCRNGSIVKSAESKNRWTQSVCVFVCSWQLQSLKLNIKTRPLTW